MMILKRIVTRTDLQSLAQKSFGDMVKAVVDVKREVMAIDAELHSDLEALLLAEGSKQDSLWGINFYPELHDENFVEFDSMINLRPSKGNKSRGVDQPSVRQSVLRTVDKWVKR
jgi:hypothetical protein